MGTDVAGWDGGRGRQIDIICQSPPRASRHSHVRSPSFTHNARVALGTELAVLHVSAQKGGESEGEMARWARSITAAAVLMMWQSNVTAQGPTYRTAIELVNLNVSVLGSDAQHVTGLREEQFEVFEDGVQQTLTFFAPADMPIDVAILLDTSASMTDSMTLVQQAAIRFAHALRPIDRATVMGISSGLRILQPLTADVAQLDQAIKSTRPGGGTPLYSSIYTALTELKKFRRDETTPRRQTIVVLSDGQDTASVFGFDELMSNVRRDAVPIYTIAPRPSQSVRSLRESVFGESTHRQDYELRTLATETGGRAFFPVTLKDLSGVYVDIANELAHQYSLGYQSSNQTNNGAFRRIALRVSAPGVKWRTRTGYLAERENARVWPDGH